VLHPHDPLRFVGTTVNDRYRITALIGDGSMSQVFEAEDLTTGRLGAMKVLHAELGTNAELAARLVREGKAMRMFGHPSIVELLDVGVLDDGRPFLVTERVRGVSLRVLVEAGRIDPLRALSIIRQVLEALDHAHRHGVIHRDIKPENIMVVESGDVVKVLDFGVAKLVEDTRALLEEANLTRPGYEVFGSPHYIAPECVEGEAIDARTDLYSVGVVLFELLAGRPPFDDGEPMALLRQHIAVNAPTLAERAPERTFTSELEYIVAEALAKQPARRFASARDMIAMIDAARLSLESPRGDTLIGNCAAAAMRPTASSVPWSRKRAFTLVMAGLTAIVLIALLATGNSAKPASAATRESSSTHSVDGVEALVERGHAELARGRELDALAAYEQALVRSPKRGTDVRLRANVATIASSKDEVAAVVALELMATRLEPPLRDEIATQASHGSSADIRRRALAIAERDGFADAIDRVQVYTRDLEEAKNCDDRRIAIDNLRGTANRRAIAPLRRARDRFPCIKREVTDALAALDARS